MDLDPSGNHHSHRRRHFPPGFDDPPPGYSPSSEAPSLSVKLYVGKIPIGATEDEIRGIFGEYGNVTEVVLMKSRRNGEPLDCCFVKYGTFEEADRAIKTLNGRYTFPGAFGHPLKVRYADKGIVVQHKIYVCGLHRQATEAEIAQIFTPFGDVEEVFIIRGDMMQHRGCAFIQFTLREMAVAAINALNGSYTMWGCDLPLIVRFADPKKPRVGGGSRTRIIDQVSGFSNESHPTTPLSPNKRCKPHLSCVGNSLDSGFQSSSSSPYALFPNGEPADYADCDWSEHICPDGHPYYYNCVTNESRWEKPEEYAAYERELLKSEHQHQHMPHLEALSTAVVAQF